MKYLVNFSGGDCSFWSADRIVKRHGAKNTVLLFADTLIEDKELYEFNQLASELLGVPITRISKELTPWQLFRREGLIGNDRFPICSTKLKREPLNEWMAANYELEDGQGNAFYEPGTVVLGFDHTEWHRVADFQAQHPTWRVEAPMTEPPLWDKCRIISECVKLGFKEKTLYRLGFPHNNCGGRCVRSGITHWVNLHRTLPERYKEWEIEEQEAIVDFLDRGIDPLTILKDRRGGETKPLSLLDLRLRIEAGDPTLPTDEWGGCGCGGATLEPSAALPPAGVAVLAP